MGLLENKVCLVTGCSRGIGHSIAGRFADEGAIVYANARVEGCIDDYCADLTNKTSGTVIPIYFDVTDVSAAKKSFSRINKEQHRLDVLVNNAGVMEDALLGMIRDEVMEDTFEVNVFSVIRLMKLAYKFMSYQKSGSIINLSSIVGIQGNAGQIVYSASKGAVAALTKSAAKELAPYNVRVNAIAPGMIDTDMFRSIGDEKIAEHLANIKMNRLGEPDEVADTAVYLASDLARYVTGQILGVDGGAIV